MREIKFRCWDKELKCMLEMEVKEKQIWFGTVNVFSEILLNHNRFIIMQFTGLLDKKGKEIYEFDRLKLVNDDIQEVKWVKETGFGFCGWDIEKGRIYEVVGNKWENPNLLNNKEGVG